MLCCRCQHCCCCPHAPDGREGWEQRTLGQHLLLTCAGCCWVCCQVWVPGRRKGPALQHPPSPLLTSHPTPVPLQCCCCQAGLLRHVQTQMLAPAAAGSCGRACCLCWPCWKPRQLKPALWVSAAALYAVLSSASVVGKVHAAGQTALCLRGCVCGVAAAASCEGCAELSGPACSLHSSTPACSPSSSTSTSKQRMRPQHCGDRYQEPASMGCGRPDDAWEQLQGMFPWGVCDGEGLS